MLLANTFLSALNYFRSLSNQKVHIHSCVLHVTDFYVWPTVVVSAVRLVQITFQKEAYRNIVAGCLLTRISTVLYSVPVQAGDILVSGEDQILDTLKKLRKTSFSFVVSVRMEQLGDHWTDFDQISYCVFFENLSRNFKFL